MLRKLRRTYRQYRGFGNGPFASFFYTIPPWLLLFVGMSIAALGIWFSR